MIRLKKSKAYFSIFFLTLSLITKAQFQTISVEGGQIPPEFNLNNDTFLIARSGNFLYNNGMKNKFKKHYTGGYLVAKESDDYSLETCRFILFEEVGSYEKTVDRNTNGIGNMRFFTSGFFIIDRKTKQKYIYKCNGSALSIEVYLKALDRYRKSENL